jgi:AraC family transcriptional regulator
VKALTGLSPMQYVLEERLNQSRPDLLFTDIPISEISLKYGFLDDNYYIRAFKKRFGKTPLQYRLDGRAARSRRTQ